RGGGRPDLDVAERAPRLLSPFAPELQAPLDDGGVGQLNDDAVCDATGRPQRLRSVACDPDGQFVLRPLEPDLHAVVAHLTAGRQIADQPAVRLHLLDADGFLTEHPTGAVAPSDAHHHPAAG